MAILSKSRYSFSLAFLVFYFVTISAKPISSFTLERFDKISNFDSKITLFGDAQIVDGGSSVKITRPSISSAGRLMYRNPVKFVEGNPRKALSFSTYFSFSISPENGDGLAFVFLPSGFPSELFDGHSFGLSPGLKKKGDRVLVVEFDTSMDTNLDNLALLGPQWWVVRVSRVTGQYTAERLARSLSRNFYNIEFMVYAPAVQVRSKLKNGSISIKPKPLFPGCIFLRCVLNKEIHDFIREYDGVGGFIGSKVGNTKRQINRPKLVSADDMEAIFRQAKEEQEKTDQAFEEEQRGQAIFNNQALNFNSETDSGDVTASVTGPKPKRKTKKGSETLVINPLTGEDNKLVPGSSVRVVSGPFMEFTGSLKKLDRKTGLATVGFMLFGKESLVDLDVNQVVAETT